MLSGSGRAAPSAPGLGIYGMPRVAPAALPGGNTPQGWRPMPGSIQTATPSPYDAINPRFSSYSPILNPDIVADISANQAAGTVLSDALARVGYGGRADQPTIDQDPSTHGGYPVDSANNPYQKQKQTKSAQPTHSSDSNASHKMMNDMHDMHQKQMQGIQGITTNFNNITIYIFALFIILVTLLTLLVIEKISGATSARGYPMPPRGPRRFNDDYY